MSPNIVLNTMSMYNKLVHIDLETFYYWNLKFSDFKL